MASPRLPASAKLLKAEQGEAPRVEAPPDVAVKIPEASPRRKSDQEIGPEVLGKVVTRNPAPVKAGRKTRRRVRKHSRKSKWSRKK